MIVVKYAIAGVEAESLSDVAQLTGLSGSVWSGYGFGAWGSEPTVFLEMAVNIDGLTKADGFVSRVLLRHGQASALRTLNGGTAGLLYADGRIEFI